jgi:predicted permease
MTLLHRLASMVRWVVRRNKAEQELDAEVRSFIELSAAAKVRAGLPAEEARRLATLELGGADQAKERVRTYRHGALIDELWRNLRYASRMFARQPGFTLVIVLTLALGIGANTTIFSLIDAVMLRWLPVPNPQELVQVKMLQPVTSGPASDAFSYPIVRALSDQREIFAALGGFSSYSFVIGRSGSISRISGAVVSGGYYAALGLAPAAGRLLNKQDDEPGAPLVAVISDGFWAREFARNPQAIGQTIPINGNPTTIVGVTPAGFVGARVGSIDDVTMSLSAIPQIDPPAAGLLGAGNFWLRVLARPQPGLPVAEAAARLSAAWPGFAEQVIAPHWPADRRKAMAQSVFRLDSGGAGWNYLREMYREPLFVLMGMVALILAIACANVASLLLARASARQREMSVRLAIGAGRGRIVAQLLTESLLLSLVGAALGIGLAWVSGGLLIEMISGGPGPVVMDLTPNWHVLAFTAAVAIATAILFGLAPAFRTTAAGASPVLKEDDRMSGSRSRLLPFLVSAQVALTLVLLIGAALFVRTLRNLHAVDLGFNRQNVLLMEFAARRTAVPQELLDAAQSVPGVLSASFSTHSPMSGAWWTEPAVPQGQMLPARDNTLFVGAGPGFFETIQTPILLGRGFQPGDSADLPAVAVVDETFAQRHFPNENPVGRHISARVRGEVRDLEIVGLAKNVRALGLRRPPYPAVYVSYAQLPGDFPTTLEMRVTGSLPRVVDAVRGVLQQKMPNVPVELRTLSAQVDGVMVQERVMATLAGTFGLLALILASIGLYGLLAYRVARRTKELGIRMTLGARRSSVIIMVLKSALQLVVIGVVLGIPAAWAASRWIASMLFRLQPTDPATFAGSAVTLLAVALLAAYVPARRASRVDPMTALRHD